MNPATAHAGLGRAAPRKSRWPAKLDLLQSGSGLVLALFMWGHMAFVSTILISRDAMWTVSRFFEGTFLFGRPVPGLVSLVVAVIFALFIVHAALALRKFPINWRQWREIRQQARALQHDDTGLWLWQVVTGYALFFLAPAHLFVMMSRPDRIGPFESADRMWSDHYWPLYLLLLFRIIFIAERQRSAFSRVYAYCIASILFFHIAVNVCMTIGLFPIIGIPLPLISYGGSSLLTFTVLIFILVRLDADRAKIGSIADLAVIHEKRRHLHWIVHVEIVGIFEHHPFDGLLLH